MLHTALHAAHLAAQAKMGRFAGYDMPLYYDMGVMAEHEWVRTQAGLFDVSHMGQIRIEGRGAASFLEYATPSSFATMPVGRAKYTVLTNPQGGIVDDLIVTRFGADSFYAVINAGCKDKDLEWLAAHLPPDVRIVRLEDRALIALQGPAAEDVLRAALGIDAASQPYMTSMQAALADGAEIFVSRLGYTGEDGFEISVAETRAASLWQVLCGDARVRPIGLAARDSLRLDMGYCLYGHDINAKTTPVEAGLSWVIGRNNQGFIGHDIVLPELANAAPRRRVGLLLQEKGIAREGAAILDSAGAAVGRVTSGGFSPTLKTGIAQGYVESRAALDGTLLQLDVRGRHLPARVSPMPFVPARTKAMAARTAA